MDVWVSIAHCKKVVFTFLPFTFYLSRYHPVTLIHNILYRSFFNQRGGRAIFLIDSFFWWISISMLRKRRRFAILHVY